MTTATILARHLRTGDRIVGLDLTVEAVTVRPSGDVFVFAEGATVLDADGYPDDSGYALAWQVNDVVTVERDEQAEVDAFHERHEARDWREDR